MARNVEIKARAGNVAELTARAARMATSGPEEIAQDDTFFHCPEGRLKLRAFSDGAGQLIFYKRPDTEGPKTSSYSIAPVKDADAMRDTLAQALGQAGRVRKHRTLFLVGRTRVHIDRVEGLGDFLELEVVLEEGEPETDGVREAEELLAALEIAQSALVDRAYVDLLEASRIGKSSRPRLHHVALWSKDIERLSAFYRKYFGACAGETYVNREKGFSSIFLSFEEGCSIELMHMASIPGNANDPKAQYIGLIHLAISVGNEEEVDAKTEELRRDGYAVVSEPRRTGDGYYESCVFDPDGNRIEITV